MLMAKYRPVARPGPGELFLSQADALRFIADCVDLGLVILGMEFFVDWGDGFMPVSGPADFSELRGQPGAVEQGAAAARRLIAAGLPDGADWVSFVVEPDTLT
jgi:hypothetical protein